LSTSFVFAAFELCDTSIRHRAQHYDPLVLQDVLQVFGSLASEFPFRTLAFMLQDDPSYA
jgi:hypothetical protein